MRRALCYNHYKKHSELRTRVEAMNFRKSIGCTNHRDSRVAGFGNLFHLCVNRTSCISCKDQLCCKPNNRSTQITGGMGDYSERQCIYICILHTTAPGIELAYSIYTVLNKKWKGYYGTIENSHPCDSK